MTWITENPMIPLITGGLLAAVFFMMWVSSREKLMLFLSLGIVAGMGLLLALEAVIVTDREELTELVYQLAFEVQENDMNQVLSYVDSNRDEIVRRVRNEMPRYDFDTCRMTGVTSFESLGGNPERCELVFNVSVRVAIGNSPEKLPGQRRVRLLFERDQNGEWKIIDYEHWDPRKGLTV